MYTTKSDSSKATHRIDGRLHLMHHIRDEEGNLITTVTGPLKVEFRLEDLCQLLAGACVMALPVALTGEVWDLGESLSIGRTLSILAVSILILAGFIWGLFYGKRIVEYKGHFFKRVLSAYVLTFLVALFLLYLFDQAPLDNMRVTLTRTVLVAFPASFAATVMDFLK